MSLIYCPECAHEVSANAVACPNCGHPTPVPVVEHVEPIIAPVSVATPVIHRREGFPTWALIPIAVLAIILIFVMFLIFRGNDDSSNMNIAVNAGRGNPANRDTRTVSVPPGESQPVSVPPTQTAVPSTQTTVPGTTTGAPVAPPPDKGAVVIRAMIVNSRGQTQPARSAKFYLLDKDVETILSQARVEPIEGNTLAGSIGLAAVFPDRYGDFQRAAMRAIGAHAKYSGTTDGGGTANVKNIAPNQYYLFCISRIGRGFALWNSPVSVNAGDNTLELSPQSITEVADTSG